MGRRAAFHTLGCKVNAYETEAMEELLQTAGYDIVPFTEQADVYVVNTCSVTNMAERKSRQMLHRAKKLNPEAVVVATGCYVQVSEEEARADAAVDLVLGNNQKRQIVTALDAYFEGRTFDDVLADVEKEQYEELEVSTVLEHTRAFVKVQDGCNQFCSYCIIPYARGRVRSRRMENVIAEIKRLAEAGIQEVVLTGIHLSSYGREIDGESHLIELIEAIHPIDGISRIRLGSLEPRIITEEFVGRLKKLHKVCPHFHLSLQSGCEETLKRMNRHYTPEEYYEKCKLLRAAFENPAITTDVIVGFPGETDEEFDKTRQFLEKVHFYEMHIFRYSRRKGTRADKMENQIPEETKAQRSGILSSLESQMTKEFRTKWTGACVKVLLEERQEGRESMADLKNTQFIDINQTKRISVSEVILRVYQALVERGYNPVNQIVGYIMSGDPTYITSHNNARSLIMKVERDEILEELMRNYVETCIERKGREKK